MNIDIVNINYQRLLHIKNKFPNAFNKHLIKNLNENNLEIRTIPEYTQCMNIILNNMPQMYDSIVGRNCFVESDEDDLETSFEKIDDKHFFLNNFLVFNKLNVKNNIYTEEQIKFQAVKDFFTLILKKEDVEILMKSLNKELNDILDIKKDNIEERLEIIDEIIEKIEKSIKTSEAEKKNYGEVFTAFALINMMLDTLPEHVWKNPYLKWLDPANGYGNFPAVIVQRLMKSLADVVIPETNLQDPKLRFKWIMEKMIYVCDINIRNMKVFVELFDREGKLGIKLNFFRGSFLSKNQKGLSLKFRNKMKEWNIIEFDIIVGNPPYNDSEGIKGGGNNLYVPFIKNSLSLLKKEGYLLFITNAGWLKKTNIHKKTVLDEILKLNLLYLNINECKKWFDVGGAMPFCYFLIQNNNNYIKTIVKSIDDNNNIYDCTINLKELEWIPRIVNNEVYSIIKKFNNQKFIFDRIDDIKTEKRTNLIGFKRLNHIVKPYCVNATNEFDKGTWIVKETNNIDSDIVFFNSSIFSFLNFIHRYDAIIYHYMINSFSYNGDLTGKNDEELYKYFNLTDKEIELIKKTIGNKNKSNNFLIKKDSNFKIGEYYKYTGRSKKIAKGEVELLKLTKTSCQIKDILGNVSIVNQNTLKIKDK